MSARYGVYNDLMLWAWYGTIEKLQEGVEKYYGSLDKELREKLKEAMVEEPDRLAIFIEYDRKETVRKLEKIRGH